MNPQIGIFSPGYCTAEGAGRLEAVEAEVGAGVVAEEANVAEQGEGLGDIQLLLESSSGE